MYLRKYSTKETPQSEKIPFSKQVENSAGGYSFVVDEWKRLHRFLILGSEGGTYYISERKLIIENAQVVEECIKKDGLRVIRTIVEISDTGKAPKNDPALFVLAMCASIGDEKTRKEAFLVLPKVARIGTHLFHFVQYCVAFRGWGRGLRKAVSNWYQDKSLSDLAFQLVKYQQRDGWSNADLLRLAHPKTIDPVRNAAYKWVVDDVLTATHQDLNIIEGFIKVRGVESDKDATKIIKDYGLPLECIPTQFKTSPLIWEVLIPKLGMTALIRNLGNISKSGFIKSNMDKATQDIYNRITNKEALKRARIHPIAILAALTTYSQGHGARGKGEWPVISSIVDALEEGYKLSFGNVEPSNKRIVLALDISGSMGSGEIVGIPGLTPRVGSCAMAQITYHIEKQVEFLAFTTDISRIDISKHTSLNDLVEYTSKLKMGGTDCALPMLWAIKNKVEVDTFIIYTDSETWYGDIHPVQALRQYRRELNIPAKLIVVAMTSNEFTIADPDDSGMLDIVGLDTATPQLITDFSKE